MVSMVTSSLPNVFLHGVGIALARLGRVAPELTQRASLAQEIPVAIELCLHLDETLLLLVAQLAMIEEAMLLGDQRFDVGENRCITAGLGHGFSWKTINIVGQCARLPELLGVLREDSVEGGSLAP